MLAFDSETHPFKPGLQAPPPVCFSFKRPEQEPFLVDAETGLDELERAIDAGELLIGHHVFYDLAVAAEARPRLLKPIFDHLARGLVKCTKIRQQLRDIRDGCNITPGEDDDSIVVIRYRKGEAVRSGNSLAHLLLWYGGRDRFAEKEADDAWRTRYHELEHLPLNQWPDAAVKYAIDDAVDTLWVYEQQGPALPNEEEQMRAAWALHLCACWGLRTDGKTVAELEESVLKKHAELQEKFKAEKFYKAVVATEEEVAEGKVDFWDDFEHVVYRKARKAEIEAGLVEFWEDRSAEGKDPIPRITKSRETRKTPFRYKKNVPVLQERVVAAYKALGQPVPMTDGGKKGKKAIKTDGDTLKYSGDEILAEFGGAGPITTIRNTFLPVLKKGAEWPINPRINCLVNTGRPSCGHPNLFNIPRKGGVRECFVPRPGFVFCSVDYDCAELRSFAQVLLWIFGKSELAEFFQKNPQGDPHLDLAASILGISEEEAKRRKKAGDKEIIDLRQAMKPVNFGIPGGMGWRKLRDSARKQYGVIFTEEEAQIRRKQCLARWPEWQWYFDFISKRIGGGGVMIEQMHPEKKPHRLRGNVGYSDAANSFFQGLTSDGAKEALWQVSYECYVDETSPLFGCRPVVFLYDEIIIEAPEWKAAEAGARLAEVMRTAMRQWLPDIPVTCEPALMRRWTKGAEAAFDYEGKLIPWDDRHLYPKVSPGAAAAV